MDPIGPLRLIRDIWRSRRGLSLKIYADRRMVMPFVAIGREVVSLPDPPRDIVIRVVNTGGTPIEVETVGLELDDGELITFADDAPELLDPPKQLERWEPRDTLRERIGARRVRRLVAIGTDDHRYKKDAPEEWRDPARWPA